MSQFCIKSLILICISISFNPDIWGRPVASQNHFPNEQKTETGSDQPGIKYSLSPQPITQVSIFKIENGSSGQYYTLQIFNPAGEFVAEKKFLKELTLSKKDFRSGLYFFRLLQDKHCIGKGRIIVK